KEALDRACALGRVAPSTAVCPPLGSDREQACWEADFYGVGLAEHDGKQVKVLVRPSTTVPEPVVALHWRLAEHIHRVVIERATSSAHFCPVGQRRRHLEHLLPGREQCVVPAVFVLGPPAHAPPPSL